MVLNDDAEFESALDRLTDLLENPPARGTPIDEELGELAAAIGSYRHAEAERAVPVGDKPTTGSATSLLSRAQQVKEKYDNLRGNGYGGLSFDSPGMGPTTGES